MTIRHLRAAAERLPFAVGTFDLVVVTMALRHWHHLAAGIAEINRVLSPGGVLVVADLFATSPQPSPLRTLWRRRQGPHGPAELASPVADSGMVVIVDERMPWIGLPDLQITAAQSPVEGA